MLYFFLKFLALFPLRWLQHLAQAVAILLCSYPSSMRRITQINLQLAYPDLTEQQHQALVKQSLKSQCMTYIESIKIWGSSPEYALSLIKDVHGAELFITALANPHGCLAAAPHFGTWELLNAWLNQYTSPVIMYKPNKNQAVDRFMLQSRQRLKSTLVPTNELGVKAVFKHVKNGGFSIILPDHVPKESGGIYSPFFGKLALSSTLVSKMAAKTQCALVGLSCIRRADLSGFELIVTELAADISSKDLQLSVDTLNREIERMISVAPEQYSWAYKRFRRAESGDDIYQKIKMNN